MYLQPLQSSNYLSREQVPETAAFVLGSDASTLTLYHSYENKH